MLCHLCSKNIAFNNRYPKKLKSSMAGKGGCGERDATCLSCLFLQGDGLEEQWWRTSFRNKIQISKLTFLDFNHHFLLTWTCTTAPIPISRHEGPTCTIFLRTGGWWSNNMYNTPKLLYTLYYNIYKFTMIKDTTKVELWNRYKTISLRLLINLNLWEQISKQLYRDAITYLTTIFFYCC